jgi:aspartate aminotransferase-like enzyme
MEEDEPETLICEEPYLVMLPGPTNVPLEVMRALLRPIVNHRGYDFGALYRRLRGKLQAVFDTKGEVVILTASGTGGIQASLEVVVRPGSRILVTAHGEFGRRAAAFARALGAEVIALDAPLGDVPAWEAIEREARRARPSVLYAVANETSTGVRLPYLKELGELARELGAFYVVDAVSHLGGQELYMDAWNIDICFTGSQKCLAAPAGLCPVALSERAVEFMKRDRPRESYFDLLSYVEYAERGETPFTPAVSLFYALDEAVNLLLREGLMARIERHRRCAFRLYEGLSKLGFAPLAKQEVASYTSLAFRCPPGIRATELRELLRKRHMVLVSSGFGPLRDSLLRLGCMGIVNDYHVNRTLSALGEALSSLGAQNLKAGA